MRSRERVSMFIHFPASAQAIFHRKSVRAGQEVHHKHNVKRQEHPNTHPNKVKRNQTNRECYIDVERARVSRS